MSHAILSPSSASRWLSCTPSARLETQYPDKAGDFAKEGTLAHEFGELWLKIHSKLIDNVRWAKRISELRKDPLYSESLEEYTGGYADFVWEKYQLAQKTTSDAVLRIEEKIDLTAYVPEGFGTGDAVILADGTMEIIDLKYGKGVRVSAAENKQMMLYALGALDMFGFMYAIHTVRMTIYQPRLDNVSEWEIPVEELLMWGTSELAPRAKMAYAGEGSFVPGKHCQFCRAKAQCRALTEKNLEVAKHEFDDASLLSDNEISKVLEQMDIIKNWMSAVEEYALQAALSGKVFPGFKLVEGRSIRKYADEKKVADRLLENGYKSDLIYEPAKLKTITAMEKLVTKKAFAAILGDLIIKPQGKPTLVPVSDKRQEWNSAENDFKNV
ncbi:DUF2800 domain-containing protein [uncultured Bacteroides sp.]|uniref:DUF2800 domain-containing protein n=1 Tax=uncultured Bacteroides sp. TaxID=162156 RepID=UPI0025FBCBC5|nr:DUF2800 domain-containing protein [uncultured Bacteroides sp.]